MTNAKPPSKPNVKETPSEQNDGPSRKCLPTEEVLLMLMPTTTLSIYSLFKPWKEFQATEKRINAKYALQREWMKTDETKVATDALSLLENVAPKLMTG